MIVLAALFCWIGSLSPCFITNCPLKVKERLNASALNSSIWTVVYEELIKEREHPSMRGAYIFYEPERPFMHLTDCCVDF